MEKQDNLLLEQKIVSILKMIYDPEIPVNIWDLGLIYKLDIDEQMNCEVLMTLTAPNCPMADALVEEVQERVAQLDELNQVTVKLTFDPPWFQDLMTEEAKLELGFL